jgi:hypothetical protein
MLTLRKVFYWHFAAIVICGSLGVADSHGLLAGQMPLYVAIPAAMVVWAAMLSIFVCPLATLIVLATMPARLALALWALLVETVLVLGQAIVLAMMSQ